MINTLDKKRKISLQVKRRLLGRWACVVALLCTIAGRTASASTVWESDGIWHIENANLRVDVFPSTGYITVRDRAADYVWRQPGATVHRPFTSVAQYGITDGLGFWTFFSDSRMGDFNAFVGLYAPGESRELHATVNIVDWSTPMGGFDFLEPFTLNTANSYLVAADYSDGHLYPTDIDAFPIWNLDYYSVNFMDMPWVGVTDLTSGLGYSVTIGPSDPFNASFKCIKFNGRRAPMVRWEPILGTYGNLREIIYTFTPNGGYVALAKAYRAYLQARGELVTLEQKRQSIPNIGKLYGAPVVWDHFHYVDAIDLKAAGVDKCLHHVGDWSDTRYTLGGGPITAPPIIATENGGSIETCVNLKGESVSFPSHSITRESALAIGPERIRDESLSKNGSEDQRS